jgi:hypothetical protein
MSSTSTTTYQFTLDSINAHVEPARPGGYLLYTNSQPKYVGRSDVDLRQELMSRYHDADGRYAQFSFVYANTAHEAFAWECRQYHELGGDEGRLDNKIHPAVPRGSECPVCHQENSGDEGQRNGTSVASRTASPPVVTRPTPRREVRPGRSYGAHLTT